MLPLFLPKIEKKLIKDFKVRLIDELGKDVVFVRLFGSKARGDYDSESDIDIFVTLKNYDEDKVNYIYELAMNLSGEYGIYLSVKVFSEDEINYYKSIPTRFISNVFKEGVSV